MCAVEIFIVNVAISLVDVWEVGYAMVREDRDKFKVRTWWQGGRWWWWGTECDTCRSVDMECISGLRLWLRLRV